MMASLPDESVESLLVTYETMVDVGDATARPRAAQLLRDSAAGCRNPLRRERLLRAAGDLDARQPAALTPEGLNSRQALAAVAEIDIAHWQPPPDPAPPPPPAPGAAEEEDSEDEEPYMEEAPPQLPHLAVRHFFEGLVVRVAQDLQGADGRAVCSSDLLTVWARQADEDGFTLACRECTVRLRASVAGHAAILENAGNAWFQPVPARECLESLVEAIARQLDRAEEDAGEDDDDRYERKLERIEALRDDVGRCQEWLSQTGERGAAPRCESGKLAAKVFGRDHAVTAWLGLFFAAVPLCME
jgi:hypothetical protein